MIRIDILYPDGYRTTLEKEEGITPEQLAEEGKEHCPYDVVACRIFQHNKKLNTPLEKDCSVDLQDMRSPYGNMSYQSSLILVYLAAVHEVFGKDVRVTINNSLSKGLFTLIHASVTDETIAEVEAHMRRIVEDDEPITETKVYKEEMLTFAKETEKKEEHQLISTAEDLYRAELAQIKDEKQLFYIHLVPSARYVHLFELRRYRNGVLLRFPHYLKPDTVPPFAEQKQLYEAFSEETHWEQLMNVQYAGELNKLVRDNDYKDLIMLSEALHEKKVAEIAEQIRASGKRIILIAGPSSSGKTSFAKRLCIQLRVAGLKPLYLGTDDYFIDRADLIPDENGNLDFESLSAVDVELFASQMNDLLAGRKADIPTYDFIQGKKIFGQRITAIGESQPVVIEGIHGLNPAMTAGIPDDAKFKIYISPLTQLNVDMIHRVPTTDARIFRRMVRDNRTRGRDAAATIRDWPSVRSGEEVNIFPYNSEADVFFNSQCLYELAVLKKYAKPLLEEITEDQPEYSEARRLLRFLRFFEEIGDESAIANNSIIREFIGGSVLIS